MHNDRQRCGDETGNGSSTQPARAGKAHDSSIGRRIRTQTLRHGNKAVAARSEAPDPPITQEFLVPDEEFLRNRVSGPSGYGMVTPVIVTGLCSV
jgi:hypothetical protein